MNLEEITLKTIKLSQEVASYIREQAKKFKVTDIEYKGMHNLVSHVDRHAEQMIMKGLKTLLPEAGFIAEESGTRLSDVYNWVIDPLDGTTNFVHGIPVYAISIALQEHNQIVSAVVCEVNLNECFYAWRNSPAYLNGNVIHVSKTQTIHDSLIATGFPYADFSRMSAYLGLFNELMRSSRGLRRLGSAAVDLAYVACGRFDSFFEYGLNPWDVAAGTLIVKQAGGRLSGFDGTNEVVFGKDILASNSFIHDEMLACIQKHFKT